jgi:hypothetical protein
MKSIKTLLTILFAAAAFTVSAQTSAVKKDTLKVSGNCGMCKSTIEKAAKSAGASFALWNEETNDLVVKYAVGKTDSKKIQQAVSKSLQLMKPIINYTVVVNTKELNQILHLKK